MDVRSDTCELPKQKQVVSVKRSVREVANNDADCVSQTFVSARRHLVTLGLRDGEGRHTLSVHYHVLVQHRALSITALPRSRPKAPSVISPHSLLPFLRDH